MAFFGVTIETIAEVKDHPNADRLDICKLEGVDFQFVTGKGLRKQGERVLYFPIDSLLPIELARALELEGKLAGKDKNRIKTIKLRNEISQGVIGDLELIKGMGDKSLTSENITEYLGVTKYEPEPIMSSSGNLLPLPDGVSVYDIEGCERYQQVVDRLMQVPVCISEKIEGTNFSVTYIKETDTVFVNQRNYTIKPLEGKENTYWKAAEDCNIIKFAKKLAETYGNNMVTVWGELIGPGIQGNIFHKEKHEIYIFDIKADGEWIPVISRLAHIENFNKFFNEEKSIQSVPILLKQGMLNDWLNGKTIKEASNGKSALYDTLREGIVITPNTEEYHKDIGRLILKQRSPEYLCKSNN